MNPRRGQDERGAIAVIVAVAIVALLGFGAIVIDIGALYVERRELQNGADAAALALADACAHGALCLPGEASGDSVKSLVDANASDGVSGVESVVYGPGNTVTVGTVSATPDGGDEVRFHVAGILGFDGDTVRAEAQATWGPPASLRTWPIAIGACELGAMARGASSTIYLHDPDASTNSGPLSPTDPLAPLPSAPCPTGPAGKPLPGGFGWLKSLSGCGGPVILGELAKSDTGNNAQRPCQGKLAPGDQIALPVFDLANGTGNNGTYHIVDFAAFVIEGFRLGPDTHGWVKNPPCDHPQTCLRGKFIRRVLDGGDIGATPTLGGITIVKLLK